MRFAFRAALAVALVAAGSAGHARKAKQPLQPQVMPTGTLIENVNGYTLDRQGALVRFNALLIDEQGRVKQLLKPGDPRVPVKFRTDGRGQTLLPGLIDSHGHVMELAHRQFELDLSGATSPADVQARISAFAAAHPRAKWIIGRGWNEDIWGRFPTAADLDAAQVDRPVWLVSADGHAGVANSRALQLVAVPKTGADPAGGRVDRSANGRPSGLFVETAMALVETVLPRDNPVVVEAAFGRALDLLASSGVTMVHDIGTSLSDWQLYRRFADEGRLNIRIYAVAQDMEVLEHIAPLRPTPWLYEDRLTMRAVRLQADGSLATRAAWLGAPYADDPQRHGQPVLSDTQIRNLMSKASMGGVQSVVQATGDAAVRQVADALAEMLPTYGRDRRYRIEHAELADAALARQLADYGAILSVQPGRAASAGPIAQRRLGATRAAQANAWGAMSAAGVRLAFGSGIPGETQSPFAAMQAAQSLSTIQAFAAYTQGGAYAAFAEDRIGSLEPGKWADFILVDRDIFAVPPDEAGQTRVIETWVAGRRVYVRTAAAPAPAPVKLP